MGQREHLVLGEDSLPSGFHDAHVHSCELNFATRTVCFDLEISVGDPDSSDSLACERATEIERFQLLLRVALPMIVAA